MSTEITRVCKECGVEQPIETFARTPKSSLYPHQDRWRYRTCNHCRHLRHRDRKNRMARERHRANAEALNRRRRELYRQKKVAA